MNKSQTYENNTIQCSTHDEKSLNFACLKNECRIIRYGCFKCMQEHHFEHLKEIKEFDEIKKDIKICLKENETIINETHNFFQQGLKYIQKIKKQFDSYRELFNNFPSQMNRTDINNVITELVDLKQGRYQRVIEKMLANSVKFIEQLQGKTEKNSKEQSNHYDFGQQEQQQLQQGEEEMQIIKVNVEAFKQLDLQVKICPEIPFNVFKEGIFEFIFSSRTIMDVDIRKLEFSLVPTIISRDDTRTLNQLGFTNECTLQMKL